MNLLLSDDTTIENVTPEQIKEYITRVDKEEYTFIILNRDEHSFIQLMKSSNGFIIEYKTTTHYVNDEVLNNVDEVNQIFISFMKKTQIWRRIKWKQYTEEKKFEWDNIRILLFVLILLFWFGGDIFAKYYPVFFDEYKDLFYFTSFFIMGLLMILDIPESIRKYKNDELSGCEDLKNFIGTFLLAFVSVAVCIILIIEHFF